MFDTDKFSDSEHTLDAVQPNNNMHINYQAHWMPFSANRNFAKDPRMIVGAKGSYLIDDSGREIFDSLSGLWTCGAGHTLPEIQQAVSAQLGQLDYSPAFQFGHPLSFKLADKIVQHMPENYNTFLLPTQVQSRQIRLSKWHVPIGALKVNQAKPN